MEKPVIKIAYADFFSAFNPEHNVLADALREHFTPVVDDAHPDFLFYSCYGVRHLGYKDCVKIFHCEENLAPDFNQCDYAISSCRMDYQGRNLYLPACFSLYRKSDSAELPPVSPEMAHREFCSFIYSHAKVGEGSVRRKEFCERLMKEYAHVDCPGAVLHNMDAPELAARGDEANWNASKIRFLSQYKFNIAYENSNADGYITEKLTDCFLANTVPIYYGGAGNVAPFPKEAMIYANDYEDEAALIARIREVNENDELYLAMLAANPLRHGIDFSPGKAITDYLEPIIQRGNKPFEKDAWKFGDAARLHRMRYCVGSRSAALRYILNCVTSVFADKETARQRRHDLKRAMHDVRDLTRH